VIMREASREPGKWGYRDIMYVLHGTTVSDFCRRSGSSASCTRHAPPGGRGRARTHMYR